MRQIPPLLKTIYDIIEFPLEIDEGKVVLSGEKNGKPFKNTLVIVSHDMGVHDQITDRSAASRE